MNQKSASILLTMLLKWLFAIAMLGALAACGGGGSSNANTNTPTQPPSPPAPPAPSVEVISGNYVKGPVAGASIEVFALDDRGRPNSTSLAQTTTAADGSWQLSLEGSRDEVLLIVARGGSFEDESRTSNGNNPVVVGLTADQSVSALLPVDSNQVTLNLVANALYLNALALSEFGGFEDNFEIARQRFELAFGFDIASSLPSNPLSPVLSDTDSEKQYAMALGGIANALNRLSVRLGQPSLAFELIEAVIADLADCQLNGKSGTRPLTVTLENGVQALPAITNLNTEILRFRNNNFASYETVPLLEVNGAACLSPVQGNDLIAPVFTSVPGAITLAAIDANGIPSDDSILEAHLSTAAATDNSGTVIISDNRAAFVDLGANVVTLTARDEALNTSIATVLVTVTDQASPTIEAPPDLSQASTGALTQIDLGEATVSDNVSIQGNIAVENDAPELGFALGVHAITWMATDEAGLTALDTQRISVFNALPAVLGPPTSLDLVEGESATINLSQYFTDSDSVLSFFIEGLPEGSGIFLDAMSGDLNVEPNDIDAKAAPFVVTVSAMDEVNSVSFDLTINVEDKNNPPSFSLSGPIDDFEDFSGVRSIVVTADPLAVDELGQTVTYSLLPMPAAIDLLSISFNSGTGEIVATSNENANGSVMLTITADDGQAERNTFSQSVTITLNAVNDAPAFTLSGDVVITPNEPNPATVTVTPLAIPIDELSQTVVYDLSPSVSFADVSIDPNSGEVTVQAMGQEGSISMVITASDGQAENNSFSQSFTLIIDQNSARQKAAPKRWVIGALSEFSDLFLSAP